MDRGHDSRISFLSFCGIQRSVLHVCVCVYGLGKKQVLFPSLVFAHDMKDFKAEPKQLVFGSSSSALA